MKKKTTSKDFYFVHGITRGYFEFVLSKTDDETAIATGFEEVMLYFDSLNVKNNLLFAMFHEGIEFGYIELSDIDKLMVALVNMGCAVENVQWLEENFEIMKKEII